MNFEHYLLRNPKNGCKGTKKIAKTKTFLKQNTKNRATSRKAVAKQTNVEYSHLYIL